MARYVVLSFEDNEQAEEFVAASRVYITDAKTNMHQTFPQLIGMYAQPTVFCTEYHKDPPGKRRTQAWTQGKNYGWTICTACHKPSGANLGTEGLFKIIVRRARNLLPEKTTG